MISKYFSLIFCLVLLLVASTAQARRTHSANVVLELDRVDANGKVSKLESKQVDFHLDWDTKNCELQLDSKLFVYCTVDASKDFVNSKGFLLMKTLPVIHFSAEALDALILQLGRADGSTKKTIEQIVLNSSSARADGFDLPTATCGQCEVTDQPNNPIVIYNAYTSFVTRSLDIHDASLGSSKLVLKLTLKNMIAEKGAFRIVRDNTDGNFGTH